MQIGAQLNFTQNWGMLAAANWDIENRVWPSQDVGVVYQNDCIRVAMIYQHNGTYNRTLTPSNLVLLRVTLPMLSMAGIQRSGL
jgi:LPS-assembly protein